MAKFCMACGHQLPSDTARVCPECGAKVDEATGGGEIGLNIGGDVAGEMAVAGRDVHIHKLGDDSRLLDCNVCGGTGRQVQHAKCTHCGGSGFANWVYPPYQITDIQYLALLSPNHPAVNSGRGGYNVRRLVGCKNCGGKDVELAPNLTALDLARIEQEVRREYDPVRVAKEMEREQSRLSKLSKYDKENFREIAHNSYYGRIVSGLSNLANQRCEQALREFEKNRPPEVGTGRGPDKVAVCAACNGQGKVRV